MPATLSYPGVYIDEVPSGARAIVGVSTAVTAFVGRARRGPVGEPVDISSFGDFERIFGGVWRLGTLGHAVQMYFQNGGNRAVVVRLYEPAGGGPAATAEVKVGQAALEAVSPGAWASGLRVTVDWNVSDDVAASLGVGAADLFNLEIRDGDGNREYIRNVSLVSTPRALGRVLPLESSLVRMKPASPALDALIAGVATARTNLAAAIAQSAAAQAATPQVPADITAAAAAVTAATTALTTALTAVRPAATSTAAVGGNDGANLTVASFTGNNAAANKTGLYALDRTDLFNLLCIPPFTATDDVDPALFADVVPLCERRRAMFLVGSPSTWTTVAAAQSNIGSFGITSANAALFFPRLRLPDPTRGGELRDFSACAAAAGVFARTDGERGLWKAPAGQDAALVGVPGLSVSLNDADNGLLNPLGINCIRALPAAGRVIWGARTRRGDDRLASEWKYTPIRRLALFIEESLYRGTQWVVFEPNDELLWSQIRLDVTAFMQGLFRQGALQGKTPREAYYVRCDRDTTTAADQRLGVVNINVGFAPLKPAEFVVLRIQQIVDTGTSEA